MRTCILTGLIGLFDIANGLYMTFWPNAWFHNAPGAMETGPFNAHFVTDMGLAYAAGGFALLAFAFQPRWRLAAFGASGSLALHGLFHLLHVAQGHTHFAGTDVAVAVPALLGMALCWPRKSTMSECTA